MTSTRFSDRSRRLVSREYQRLFSSAASSSVRALSYISKKYDDSNGAIQKKGKKEKEYTCTYTTLTKNLIRGMVAQTWKDTSKDGRKKGKIIYLDGPRGEATNYFIEQAELSKADLCPVNRDVADAARIREVTDMRVLNKDIFELHKLINADARHVLWLDLEQNIVSIDELKKIAQTCAVLHLTLSCRAEQPFDVCKRAEKYMLACGFRVQLSCKYRGRTGNAFMAHIVAVRDE